VVDHSVPNGAKGAGLDQAVDEAFVDLGCSSRSISPEEGSLTANSINTRLLSSGDTIYSSCCPDQRSDLIDSVGEEYYTAQSQTNNLLNIYNNEHTLAGLNDSVPVDNIVDAVNSTLIEEQDLSTIPSIEIDSPTGATDSHLSQYDRSSNDITISTVDTDLAHHNIRQVIGQPSDPNQSPSDLDDKTTNEPQTPRLDESIESNSTSGSNRKNSSRSLEQNVLIENELGGVEESTERAQVRPYSC